MANYTVTRENDELVIRVDVSKPESAPLSASGKARMFASTGAGFVDAEGFGLKLVVCKRVNGGR